MLGQPAQIEAPADDEFTLAQDLGFPTHTRRRHGWLTMLASGGHWRCEDELLIDAAAIIGDERCCWQVIDEDVIGRAGLTRCASL